MRLVCVVRPQIPFRTSMARVFASADLFPLLRIAYVRRVWLSDTSPKPPTIGLSWKARSADQMSSS